MLASHLHCLSYRESRPELASAPRAALPGHALIGRLAMGHDAWLGAGSVIRADGHFVRIGNALHLGRGATVHIAHDLYPTLIGDRAVIGTNTVVHACTLGDDVVVEDDSVILDGSVLGAGAVIEAGSIVFPRSLLEAGMLYAGRPARVVRALAPGEGRARADQQRRRNEAGAVDWPCRPVAARAAPDCFVADTACLAGEVQMAAGSSVWYGCRLEAGKAPITIGVRCNVQDNSVLRAGVGGVSLGAETTIGHNVFLEDCKVGARCLVGIGSRIAPGTTIADDAFVAAGAVTDPGQHLQGGLIWGGKPARPLGPLDDAKRAMILRTAQVYQGYAQALGQ
jgi:carbonic anhydrase/acetyltransferase-like protein (isoleucine patch superfamily)